MSTCLFQRIRAICFFLAFVFAFLALPGISYAATVPQALGSYAPGSIVKLRENGVLNNFIVVKHGYPTSSNKRTLLLRKNIINNQPWNSTELTEFDCGYSGSTIDTWLNSTYYTYLDSYVQNEVTNVTIRASVDTATTNISRKVFLLSSSELFSSGMGLEGAYISFFSDALNRIAHSDADLNAALEWWTCSQQVVGGAFTTISVDMVTATGGLSTSISATNAKGIRPALTLLSSNAVDEEGTILEYHVPSTPANLSVQVEDDVQISWDAASDDDGDLAGYMIERSIDDGSTWSLISTQDGTTLIDAIQDDWSAVSYRVKAYDGNSAQSGYVSSSSFSFSPEITSLQVTPNMNHMGGNNEITVNGVHLPDGIQVSIFSGEDAIASGTTTGSGIAQTATVVVPANTSETDNTIYTVRASLDSGNTWDDITATVTVLRQELNSDTSHSGSTKPRDTITIPEELPDITEIPKTGSPISPLFYIGLTMIFVSFMIATYLVYRRICKRNP